MNLGAGRNVRLGELLMIPSDEAIVLYQIILATATTLGQTCGSTSIPTNDTGALTLGDLDFECPGLKEQTVADQSSFQCANDAFGLSACEYGDLLNAPRDIQEGVKGSSQVANMMYANFYVNGLQFLVCMVLSL